jgi:hypothetical protein
MFGDLVRHAPLEHLLQPSQSSRAKGADGDARPGKPVVERRRLEHRDRHEQCPAAGEQVAEAFADGDAEVAMEGRKHNRRRLARRRARVRILVGARERRDEERPAGKAEELDDRRQHANRRRDGDELELVAREHLSD